jgi:ABC-2 type transport system permease protein
VTRAAGDAADGVSWLTWLTPLGWVQRIRPFAGEQWWLLGVVLVLGAAVAVGAFALSARRDVGSGMFRPRLGPAQAAPRLRTPFALAWRLHRGMLAGWTAAFLVLGSIYGSVAVAVGDMLRDNPDMQEIFARLGGGADTIIDLYLAGVAGILALIVSGYAIAAALRMRVEEDGQRLEPVLATAVTRRRWMAAQLVFALGGPAVTLVAGGLALGLAYGSVSGDIAGQIPRILAATLVQLPAVWLLTAIAVALFGLSPRLCGATWGVFGLVVFITFIGALLRLGPWFMNLSPFTHIPALPGADFVLLPLLALSGIVGALVVAGLGGFNRRDLG